MIQIFHNPRCSKSREALALLDGLTYEVVEYLKTPPTEAELLALLKILEGEPRDLVRTKEESFREKPFSLTDPRVIAHELAKRPELLERPIVVRDGKRAMVGRPPERIQALLD